jgi:hypothetical protein
LIEAESTTWVWPLTKPYCTQRSTTYMKQASKRATGRRWRVREMALCLGEFIAEENADAEV